MSANVVVRRVEGNPSGMGGTLPKSSNSDHIWEWGHCFCCGIHGAARERKGVKDGTHAALRRHGKRVIKQEMDDLE